MLRVRRHSVRRYIFQSPFSTLLKASLDEQNPVEFTAIKKRKM
jgi:hypothetical protein